jgi:hypothetical protein
LTQLHLIYPVGVHSGAPVVAASAVGQGHAFGAVGLKTTEPSVGTPNFVITYDFNARPISATPTIGAAAVSQAHNLAAERTSAGAPVIGAPGVGQTHLLAALGIRTDPPILFRPAFAQEHLLGAVGVESGQPVVGVAAFGQAHAFSLVEIETGSPTVGSPDPPGQYRSFVARGVILAPVLTVPRLSKPPRPTVASAIAAQRTRAPNVQTIQRAN